MQNQIKNDLCESNFIIINTLGNEKGFNLLSVSQNRTKRPDNNDNAQHADQFYQ